MWAHYTEKAALRRNFVDLIAVFDQHPIHNSERAGKSRTKMKVATITLAILALTTSMIVPAAGQSRGITPEDYFAFKFLSDVQEIALMGGGRRDRHGQANHFRR